MNINFKKSTFTDTPLKVRNTANTFAWFSLLFKTTSSTGCNQVQFRNCCQK